MGASIFLIKVNMFGKKKLPGLPMIEVAAGPQMPKLINPWLIAGLFVLISMAAAKLS